MWSISDMSFGFTLAVAFTATHTAHISNVLWLICHTWRDACKLTLDKIPKITTTSRIWQSPPQSESKMKHLAQEHLLTWGVCYIVRFYKLWPGLGIQTSNLYLNRHASLTLRICCIYWLLWWDQNSPPLKQTEEEGGRKINFTAQSNKHYKVIREQKWNVKTTGLTRVLGHTWLGTKQPVYTVFAVQCADVPGAADTWLGYISALVTKRHEPRGGNHGSRDFCQRCTPVIAEELSCNVKHLSTDPLSDRGQSDGTIWPKRLKLQAEGSRSTWIWPE